MPSIEPSHYGRRREQLIDDIMQVDTDIINKSEQLDTFFQVWNDRASRYTKSRYADPVIDSLVAIKSQHLVVTDAMALLSKSFTQMGVLWNAAYTFDEQYCQSVEALDIQKQKAVDIERKSELLRQSSEEVFANAQQQLEQAENNRNLL